MLQLKLTILIVVFFLCKISFGATGECTGNHHGSSVVLRAHNLNLLNRSGAVGQVFVDGREVARFYNRDSSVNILLKKVTARNAHGEMLAGKLHNVRTGAATVSRLLIPAFGIDFTNFNVKCRSSN
ncbi:MAG TPA: hypothetical protein VNJ01_12560 [Bacteriovoracaceae bacterium]|nr:hypothetical protein [Bacteriovoracaceae bacterium]